MSWVGRACRSASLLGGGLLALGCGSAVRDQPSAAGDTSDGVAGTSTDGSGGNGGGTGTVSTGGTSSTTDTNSSTTGGTGGDVCVPGIPPTSQMKRLLNREYDAIVNDLLGVSGLGVLGGGPPSELLNPDFEGPMNSYAWEGYLEAADRIAAEVIAGPNKSRFIDCDPTLVESCYEDTIVEFGRKAFRRPLRQDEVERFMEFTTLEPPGTPDEIAEAMLFAFLAAPSFIMTPEVNEEQEAGALKLSSFEQATRLSLTLWGSAPDEELNRAADAGELSTKEQIWDQAERMLAQRDKAGPQLARAHASWLDAEHDGSHWWKISHDPELFPNFTQATQRALRDELYAFFEEIAYAGASFGDIFLSNLAFVSQDSAWLYGLDPADFGSGIERVELDAGERPGILTRAGFLSSYSHHATTSPILRGTFISINILGLNPGPPDPEALRTPMPEGTYLTERELVEALTSPPGCAVCHDVYLNPPGFVLENYDAVGAWQSEDPRGGAIDPVAEVMLAPGDVRTISSALELMQAIAELPGPRQIYAQELVSFYTRRPPNAYDACTVDALAARLAPGNGYPILELAAELTQADSFRLRSAGN